LRFRDASLFGIRVSAQSEMFRGKAGDETNGLRTALSQHSICTALGPAPERQPVFSSASA